MWDNIEIVLRGIWHAAQVAAVPLGALLVVMALVVACIIWLDRKNPPKTGKDAVLGQAFEIRDTDEGIFMTGILTDEGVAFFNKIERYRDDFHTTGRSRNKSR